MIQVEENAKAVCKGEGQENAYGPLTDEEVNVSPASHITKAPSLGQTCAPTGRIHASYLLPTLQDVHAA